MLSYREKYAHWCTDDAFDEETKQELLALQDEKEIEDRFYKELEFGTAGLRGIMGAGTNRINRYTVGRATLGLARTLLKEGPAKEKGVVIAYDTRNNSAYLAKTAADVLTSLDIPVYLFDQPVPTPALSFSVRHLGCAGGIVLTASHNPPAYNGYKVYGESGCQLGVEQANEVLEEIHSITDFSEVPQGGKPHLVTPVGDDLLETFVNAALRQSTLSDAKAKEDLRLVYTPIHGTGRKAVLQILKKAGFSKVHVVKEQEWPDGNFPTVKSPNPEERGALELGIALAKETDSDLVIGTDPDADRIGCATCHKGEMVLLTGNEVGALLVDFLLQNRAVVGENPVVISTVVTSDLGPAIARKRGCEVAQVLTGFKFIGDKVSSFEVELKEKKEGAHHFLLGYEESYGYLAGTHARDKDAVVASLLISEMAAYHKSHGRSLVDALNLLYEEFGYYLDKVKSFTLEGKEGIERIGEMMKAMRSDPDFLPGVEQVIDYEKGYGSLPPSNVLKFYLQGGSWVAARPSGTEPKIKFYYCIRENKREEAQETLARLQKLIREKTGL